MGIFDHALTVSADAQLDHGSVVQDLNEDERERYLIFSFAIIVACVHACSVAQLRACHTVPAYLHRWVSMLDVVLQVAHQHQVAGLVPT